MTKDVNDDETAAGSSVENAFLDLLDQDIAARPERLQQITPDLVRSAQSPVGGVSLYTWL